MSEQEHDDTYINEFGFRPFEGSRHGRLYRIWAITEFNFVQAIKKSRFTTMLLLFIIIGILIQSIIMYFTSMFFRMYQHEYSLDDLFVKTIIESTLGTFSLGNYVFVEPMDLFFGMFSTITGSGYSYLLLIALASGGMIADDKLYRMDELYFSHVSRFEYLLGKLAALMLFSFILIIGPTAFRYFLLASSLGVDASEHLGVLLWSIGFTFFATAIICSIALAISSLTRRRTLATILLFASFVMLAMIPMILRSSISGNSSVLLLDLMLVLDMVGLMMADRYKFRINWNEVDLANGVGLEWGDVLMMATLMVLFAVVVLYYKVIRRSQ